MKSILLIGLGRYGRHIAKVLNELGHEVMAVDFREECVDAAMSYVTSAMIGDTTDPDFLKSLGISNYDACIVAIGDDFLNTLETTTLLKDYGAKYVIARASKNRHERILLRNGADEVVYPEKQLARWTAIRCSSDHIFDYIELDKEYAIMEVNIPKIWAHKSIIDINIRKKYNINIIALKRDDKMSMNIMPETILEETDRLFVVGKVMDIQRCFSD